MPPTDRFVPAFAAEPPQEGTPSGRWEQTLAGHFDAAVAAIDTEGEDLGDRGPIKWFPDRTWSGRTFLPATARTAGGFELFGYVSYSPGTDGAEPGDFIAHADFTSETAENNADWQLDLNDEVIGTWRGEGGNTAEITLVWGVPLIANGALVTAELADLAVDQAEVVGERFTLLAPDNYMGDFLDVKLWSQRGRQLTSESLYVDDEE
jgi:hypothetical protein